MKFTVLGIVKKSGLKGIRHVEADNYIEAKRRARTLGLKKVIRASKGTLKYTDMV